jgi:hypothetical protein
VKPEARVRGANPTLAMPNKSCFRSRSLPSEKDSVYWALWEFMENLQEEV